MWHPMWEPLWKAVHEVGLPLHFHTFPTLPPGKLDSQSGLIRRAAFFTAVSGFQMNLVNILAAIVGALCSSAIRTSASRSARAASAGCRTRSTAWTSSGRTASATSA